MFTLFVLWLYCCKKSDWHLLTTVSHHSRNCIGHLCLPELASWLNRSQLPIDGSTPFYHSLHGAGEELCFTLNSHSPPFQSRAHLVKSGHVDNATPQSVWKRKGLSHTICLSPFKSHHKWVNEFLWWPPISQHISPLRWWYWKNESFFVLLKHLVSLSTPFPLLSIFHIFRSL